MAMLLNLRCTLMTSWTPIWSKIQHLTSWLTFPPKQSCTLRNRSMKQTLFSGVTFVDTQRFHAGKCLPFTGKAVALWYQASSHSTRSSSITTSSTARSNRFPPSFFTVQNRTGAKKLPLPRSSLLKKTNQSESYLLALANHTFQFRARQSQKKYMVWDRPQLAVPLIYARCMTSQPSTALECE